MPQKKCESPSISGYGEEIAAGKPSDGQLNHKCSTYKKEKEKRRCNEFSFNFRQRRGDSS